MTLALFDFDGTISNRDSMRLFLRHCAGSTRYRLGCLILSPIILAYFLKLIDPRKSKEILLTWFLGDMSRNELEQTAEEFAIQVLPNAIRPGALNEMELHRQKGSRIIVVSASCELWLKDWCDANKLELIATKMEVRKDRYSGKIEGQNCRDEEKVNRIVEQLNLKDFDRIIAYGDSSGDRAMFEIADEVHFKPFRD